MFEVAFSHPWLLLLALAPLALPLVRRLPAFLKRGALPLSTYDWLPASSKKSAYPRRLADFLRAAALICLVLIVAGIAPVSRGPVGEEQPEALVIVLDISSSMTAEDFSPGNRLRAAKQLLKSFASTHSDSELGLILLSASPRLMVPVSAERDALLRALDEASPAGYEEDGTAIGSGIASAINRLRDGSWSRRTILLVTDGVNNRGALAPTDAARIAAGMGIRIDTVGIGTDSVSHYWAPLAQGGVVEVEARIEIDDKELEEVARITGGRYRRATNSDQLRLALLSLDSGRRQVVKSESSRWIFSWVQILAAASILLIYAEFVLTRFAYPELPG
jgi:Ca-activated chloride channel family protein